MSQDRIEELEAEIEQLRDLYEGKNIAPALQGMFGLTRVQSQML